MLLNVCFAFLSLNYEMNDLVLFCLKYRETTRCRYTAVQRVISQRNCSVRNAWTCFAMLSFFHAVATVLVNVVSSVIRL